MWDNWAFEREMPTKPSQKKKILVEIDQNLSILENF
jgi:hypothetical protein